MELTNSSRFFENLVNTTHKILGVELKPFCLLHFLFLEQIGSPFFSGAAGGTLEDLEKAVLICSGSSASEIAENLGKPSTGILGRIRRILWHRRNRLANLNAEVLKFLSYLGDFASLPEFREKDGKEPELPHFLLCMAACIKNTGWTQEQVLLLPFGNLFWLNLAFGYLNSGESNVVGDAEIKARERLESLTRGQ